MIEILPTVVPDTFEDIVRLANTAKAFAKKVHIDVADGIFAPNTTWMPSLGEKLPDGMEYEIHLMVADPYDLGLAYAEAGATSLIGHAEEFESPMDAEEMFAAWRDAGAKEVTTGVLLQTSLESLEPYVEISDAVLLMTIARIGVQGIPFEKEGIARVKEFRKMHPKAKIGVDGGVSEKNIAELKKAGAAHFCVGSAISKSPDPEKTYKHLLSLVK